MLLTFFFIFMESEVYCIFGPKCLVQALSNPLVENSPLEIFSERTLLVLRNWKMFFEFPKDGVVCTFVSINNDVCSDAIPSNKISIHSQFPLPKDITIGIYMFPEVNVPVKFCMRDKFGALVYLSPQVVFVPKTDISRCVFIRNPISTLQYPKNTHHVLYSSAESATIEVESEDRAIQIAGVGHVLHIQAKEKHRGELQPFTWQTTQLLHRETAELIKKGVVPYSLFQFREDAMPDLETVDVVQFASMFSFRLLHR